MAIIVGNKLSNPSLSSGKGCLHSANTFGKGINPTIPSPPMVNRQTGLFNLVMVTGLGE